MWTKLVRAGWSHCPCVILITDMLNLYGTQDGRKEPDVPYSVEVQFRRLSCIAPALHAGKILVHSLGTSSACTLGSLASPPHNNLPRKPPEIHKCCELNEPLDHHEVRGRQG